MNGHRPPIQVVRTAVAAIALFALAACATTKRPAYLTQAEQLYSSLESRGGEQTVEAEMIKTRQALEAARGFEQRGERGRAQVEALRAQAEARYARAAAERDLAQREETRARAALAALPPGGAR